MTLPITIRIFLLIFLSFTIYAIDYYPNTGAFAVTIQTGEPEENFIEGKAANLWFRVAPAILEQDASEQSAFLNLRLADASNQTYPHVTYIVNLTRITLAQGNDLGEQLLHDYFHSHSGPLALNISLTNGTAKPLLAPYGPKDSAGSWLADQNTNAVSINSTASLAPGIYQLQVKIFSVEQDGSILQPKDRPSYTRFFSLGGTVEKIFSYSGSDHNVTAVSYVERISNFTFDPDRAAFSWSIPFDWNNQHLNKTNFVHQELFIPKALSQEFLARSNSTELSFLADVNGIPLDRGQIALDPYNEDSVVIHILLSKNVVGAMKAILAESDASTGKMTFTIAHKMSTELTSQALMNECQELNIEPDECSEEAILQKTQIQIPSAQVDNQQKSLHDSYWIMTFPFEYLIGIGAALAGIIAFFTLWRRRH